MGHQSLHIPPKPPNLGSKMNASVVALDLTRRKYAYDGEEPDWAMKISVPMALADYAFTFQEIVNLPLKDLKTKLGDQLFQQIVDGQGYRPPVADFLNYKGEDDLPVYCYTRPDKNPGSIKLLLVSMGEYQPGRYIAHFEGIWRLTNCNI